MAEEFLEGHHLTFVQHLQSLGFHEIQGFHKIELKASPSERVTEIAAGIELTAFLLALYDNGIVPELS